MRPHGSNFSKASVGQVCVEINSPSMPGSASISKAQFSQQLRCFRRQPGSGARPRYREYQLIADCGGSDRHSLDLVGPTTWKQGTVGQD